MLHIVNLQLSLWAAVPLSDVPRLAILRPADPYRHSIPNGRVTLQKGARALGHKLPSEEALMSKVTMHRYSVPDGQVKPPLPQKKDPQVAKHKTLLLCANCKGRVRLRRNFG
jgi:hypothetical protein